MKHLFILLSIFLSFVVKSQTREELYMIKYINQLRVTPKSFIPYVESYIEKQELLKINGGLDTSKLKVKVIKISSSNVRLRDELITEANKLIKFLETQTPVKELKQNYYFYKLAKTHANYLDSNNIVSHTGSNGVTFGARTKGYYIIENVCRVSEHDVIDCLIQLLLDYGLTEKGHRNNLFNPQAKEVSVANTGKVWIQEFIYTLK